MVSQTKMIFPFSLYISWLKYTYFSYCSAVDISPSAGSFHYFLWNYFTSAEIFKLQWPYVSFFYRYQWTRVLNPGKIIFFWFAFTGFTEHVQQAFEKSYSLGQGDFRAPLSICDSSKSIFISKIWFPHTLLYICPHWYSAANLLESSLWLSLLINISFSQAI